MSAASVRGAWLLAAGAVLVTPAVARAQSAEPGGRRLRPEARVDAIAASRSVVHAGLGAEVPVSSYARLEGVLGAGPRLGPGGPAFSARADALARFVLDPLVQLARSPYAAAGVSVRGDRDRTRADVVALLGLQLRARRGYAPAVELGLGGGVRLGVVVRRAR